MFWVFPARTQSEEDIFCILDFNPIFCIFCIFFFASSALLDAYCFAYSNLNIILHVLYHILFYIFSCIFVPSLHIPWHILHINIMQHVIMQIFLLIILSMFLNEFDCFHVTNHCPECNSSIYYMLLICKVLDVSSCIQNTLL